MKRKNGNGKIRGESPRPIGEAATLALADLTPSMSNRQERRDEDLKGLASSIAEVGLLYPIIVRPDEEKEGAYHIIAGERRWRALKLLKCETAPCVVVSGSQTQSEVLRVVENHQRRPLEPLEEAAAIRGLLDLGLEPEAIARSLGRSRSWVARRSSLTDLSERWVREVKDADGKISTWPPSHLEVIARFPEEIQNQMLDRWGHNLRQDVPGLRELESFTSIFLHLLASAPWKQDDALLCPTAGACTACPKRSSHAPELFPEDLPGNDGRPIAGDCCLDAVCWDNKAMLYLTHRNEELRQEHPRLILLNAGDAGDGAEVGQKLNAPVRNAWDATLCKKSDEKAVPALIVSGPGLGRLKWVQPIEDSAPPAANGRRAGHASDGEPAVRTPEEKKEPYDKRRRQLVIDGVKHKLEALAVAQGLAEVHEIEGGPRLVERGLIAKTIVLMHALVSEMGWRSTVHDRLGDRPENLAWEALERLKNHEIGTGDMRQAIFDLCWHLLRLAVGKLGTRLSVGLGERNNEAHYAEAERICAMLDFDLASATRRSRLRHPLRQTVAG